MPVFAELWIVPHSITSTCVRKTTDSSTQHHPLSYPVKLALHYLLGSKFHICDSGRLFCGFLCISLSLHKIAAECFRQNIPIAPAHAVYCAARWPSQYLYPAANGQHNTGLCKVKLCNQAGAPSFGEILPSSSECSLILSARFQRLTVSMLYVRGFWNVTPYRLLNCCHCSRLDPDDESTTIRKHLQRTRRNVPVDLTLQFRIPTQRDTNYNHTFRSSCTLTPVNPNSNWHTT